MPEDIIPPAEDKGNTDITPGTEEGKQPEGAGVQAGDTDDKGTEGLQAGGEEAKKADGLQAGDDDGKGAEGDDPSKEPESQPGAPENYENFKLPEGQVIKPEVLEDFVPLAKELGLTQEQAQKLVDFNAGMLEAEIKEQDDAFLAQKAQNIKDLKADKELGGGNYEKTVASATKPLHKFWTVEEQQWLVDAGVANRPEFVRGLHAIHEAFGEDVFVKGEPKGKKLRKGFNYD